MFGIDAFPRYTAVFTNVHMPTQVTTTQVMATTTQPMATTTQPMAKTIASACAKCGISRKSGKLSYCAHGGSWYKQCGDPGDSKFYHTWDEGTQACEGKCTIFAIDTFVRCIMHP